MFKDSSSERNSGLSGVTFHSESKSKVFGKAKSQSLLMFLKQELLLVGRDESAASSCRHWSSS